MGGIKRKKASKQAGSSRGKSGHWEKVDVKHEQLGPDGLDGFSGLEVWKGPVFEKPSGNVESSGDVAVEENCSKAANATEKDGSCSKLDETKTKKKKKVRKRGKRKQRSGESGDNHIRQSKKAKQSAKSNKKPLSRPQDSEQQEEQDVVDTSAWEDLHLHPLIHKALGLQGFSNPMPIQSHAIMAAVRDRKDVLGAAQTGSGKTLAFGLPIVQILLAERNQEKPPDKAPDLTSDCSELEEITDEEELHSAELPSPNTLSSMSESDAEEDHGDQDEDMFEEIVDADAEHPPLGPLEDGIDDDEIIALDRTLGITPITELSLDNSSPNPLKGLILTPTRELALQVCKHLEAIGKVCGIQFVPVVGGMSKQKQERMLNRCPEVVVATPGRLWDLMTTQHPHVSDLSTLKFLVIDEADKMIKAGNFKELFKIMDVVPEYQIVEELEDFSKKKEEVPKQPKGKKKGRPKNEDVTTVYKVPDADRKMQTFVFSATLTLPKSMHNRLRKGGGGAADGDSMDTIIQKVRFRKSTEVIDLTGKRGVADGVVEACLPCSEDTRDVYLYSLLEKHPGRTMVFVNAISSVKRVSALLRILGIAAQPIHALKQQRQRLKALDRFRDDANGVLVATDIAARGLDIKDVRCVIHYQVAASADVYIHRSGRTARIDKEGLSVSLVVPKEALRFSALFSSLNRPVPIEFPLDVKHVFEAKRRFAVAIKIDEIDRKLGKGQARDSWIDSAAKDMGFDEDAKEIRKHGVLPPSEREKLMRNRAVLMSELNSLGAASSSSKFNHKFFTGSAETLAAATKAAKDIASGQEKQQGKQNMKGEVHGKKKVKSGAERGRGLVKKDVKPEDSGEGKAPVKDVVQARKERQKQKADEMIRALMEAKGYHKKALDGSHFRQKLVIPPTSLGRNTGGVDALGALRLSKK